MINDAECEHAGLDPHKVELIAKRLESAAKDAAKLGLTVFGGTGSGSLRFNDAPSNPHSRPLIVATMRGRWDGGCGACSESEDGLLRGE